MSVFDYDNISHTAYTILWWNLTSHQKAQLPRFSDRWWWCREADGRKYPIWVCSQRTQITKGNSKQYHFIMLLIWFATIFATIVSPFVCRRSIGTPRWFRDIVTSSENMSKCCRSDSMKRHFFYPRLPLVVDGTSKNGLTLESVIYARQHGCVYLDQRDGVHFGFETGIHHTHRHCHRKQFKICLPCVCAVFHVQNNFHVSKVCPVEMARDDTSKANDLMDLCYHAIVHWNMLIQ